MGFICCTENRVPLTRVAISVDIPQQKIYEPGTNYLMQRQQQPLYQLQVEEELRDGDEKAAASTTSKPTTSRERTTSRGHCETEQEVPHVDRLTYDPES